MLINRLYLRNFRVYEQELELEMPPGLVGIYGANGSGKSTLLEAILFTLYGKARTNKDQIRSSGVTSDCVTELEFEHEGHIFTIRRTITGSASSIQGEAHCDGLGVAEGQRDTTQYVQSILGMDDDAFRASVFAEQKQLDAFSSHTPAERFKLVLSLLGITPLDTARDRARKDARTASERYQLVRTSLPDMDALELLTSDTDAAAGAAEKRASEDEHAVEDATKRLGEANVAFSALDRKRQEHDQIVASGKGIRAEHDRLTNTVLSLKAEQVELEQAEIELKKLQPTIGELAILDGVVGALSRVHEIASALDDMPDEPELGSPSDNDLRAARSADEDAKTKLAELAALENAANEALASAKHEAESSSVLSADADCPLCGQELGDAFEAVRTHRQSELAKASERQIQANQAAVAARDRAKFVATSLIEVTKAHDEALKTHDQWRKRVERRTQSEVELANSIANLESIAPGLLTSKALVDITATLAERSRKLAQLREDAAKAERLTGRLERRVAQAQSLAEAEKHLLELTGQLQGLRDQIKTTDYDAEAWRRSSEHVQLATDAFSGTERIAKASRLEATKLRANAEGESKRLFDAREQHSKIGDLETDSRYLSRVGELLADFRNSVVSSVGPRLAVQAAELFGELTDREYDRLEVDPETFQLQITDKGESYGLERFSGSETDLANLALRVAISEHVRFQSGGAVGLMVLDEVFGPLDEDRKARMLGALEQLRARFRQILVVTHDTSIKDELPSAIEVQKLPGRRASASVILR